MSATAGPARLRVAIYAPDGSVRAIVTGTQKTIEANTPPGGVWRALPSSVRRVTDVRRAAPASAGSADRPPQGAGG